MDRSFGKDERLSSRKVITSLFREGKSIKKHPLRMLYLAQPKTPAHVQILMSVAKRRFPKAVDRNRIKRLMREAYRIQKHELVGQCAATGQYIALAFVYIGSEAPSQAQMTDSMGWLLKNLIDEKE